MQKACKKLSFASFFEEKKNKISVSKKAVIRLFKKLYKQNAVAEVLPLKQGLKLLSSYTYHANSCCSRGSSIKTRIETLPIVDIMST